MNNVKTVLLVGVSLFRLPTENAVEQRLVDAGFEVVATGLVYDARGAQFDNALRWPNYLAVDGRRLPFSESSFDLVYSNAVIEHVGFERAQRAFVAEHNRVGKNWIITCPNRWFPVESHTDVLFRHWKSGFTDEYGSITRLLGPRDLRALLPDTARIHGHMASPTLTATSS